MLAFIGLLVAVACSCVCATEITCGSRGDSATGNALLQHATSVGNANLQFSGELMDEDWTLGTATFYGDGGSGGACGGSELGDYGTGQSWINGLYAATSSSMWCGNSAGSCGSTHAPDCGRCYKVQCVGTTTNTDGYEPCTDSTVTVAITDECPGASALLQVNQTEALTGHCGGNVQHFDLSTKAFKIIGDERAGVINIKYQRVSCAALGNMKLRFHGTRWHFKVAPWDVNGPGSLSEFEVKNTHLGKWTSLKPSYGAFWVSDVDIGDGPYEFRITADDGQALLYILEKSIADVSGSVLDIGKNFQAEADSSVVPTPLPTSLQTRAPTSAPTSRMSSETETTTLEPSTSLTTKRPEPTTSVENGKTDCMRGWGQCGGKGFNGPTCCSKGFECVFDNDWWSACKPLHSP